MNYNQLIYIHIHIYLFRMFILYESLIFFKGMDRCRKCTYTRNKTSINVFLTIKFSREIIKIAVQFTNQIYMVLRLHINRNGSFDQEDLHARTYEETFVYYDCNLNVKIEKIFKNKTKRKKCLSKLRLIIADGHLQRFVIILKKPSPTIKFF